MQIFSEKNPEPLLNQNLIKYIFIYFSNICIFNNAKTNRVSIKIVGFGLAKETNSFLNDSAGTIYYQSPQIVKNEHFTFKTDVW